ncbi:glutamate ligase domain-containing protein [Curtobacterium poinsettiae]|uniref:glutamate ligase domain-containing protein n=1 Tax=Curtobacterium TaxID=2034 RepID=UPI0020327E32|nr:cyanophycin synthetase [Curtobacterium flaccumfaciens]WQM79073.1 hypothetical protein PCFP21_105 [Curtobacterium flaccumfaciens pv. poinsettiae]WQM79229.1 hypothetical protein PCFP23_400 [Curtobacterium flaccumfaciens pv. poinsettiae]WQM79309.1 hypothetical protein PCFP24_295 [Curtobacterium flaccumfaciens pv. poinsettiae]WQM79383.1 hypothetical protein PCFP11_180 [Curtobacterium flaccumfaciens pv. poinsettiae]WRK13082.1 hypothetical protein PCFP22_285 [Curtobacterium flaccumfaciens pv. poi
MQIVSRDPVIILDAAHNPHGARSLASTLADLAQGHVVIAVLGVLADEDAAGIVNALSTAVDHFIITASHSDRAVPPAKLANLVSEVVGKDRVTVAPDTSDALTQARRQLEQASSRNDGLIVVTGSITLIGEALDILDPAARLSTNDGS